MGEQEKLDLGSDRYFALPQPDQIPEREREDAMGAYLMMFAAIAMALPLPVINLIASLIYYFANRRKSRFVHFHSLQSLLTQIPTSILNWILVVWAVRIYLLKWDQASELFYGFVVLVIAVNLAYYAFSLIAAYHARKGRMYYFVLFGKASFERVFSRTNNLQYIGGLSEEVKNRTPFEQ